MNPDNGLVDEVNNIERESLRTFGLFKDFNNISEVSEERPTQKTETYTKIKPSELPQVEIQLSENIQVSNGVECDEETQIITHDDADAKEIMYRPKKELFRTSGNLPSSPPLFSRQPPDGDEFPPNYKDPVTPVFVGTLNELKDSCEVICDKHSSGCEDSGVFLEDSPFPHETTAIVAVQAPDFPLEKQALINSHIYKETALHSDSTHDIMRHYSIKPQASLESDGESRSDTGVTSTSTDSADELDIIPPLSDMIPPISRQPPVAYNSTLNSNHHHSVIDKEVIDDKDFSYNRKGIPHEDFTATRDKNTQLTNHVLNERPQIGNNEKKSFQRDRPKWKSEEYLVSDRQWSTASNRRNEKVLSVKDRIAMFSELESDPSLSVRPVKPQFLYTVKSEDNGNCINSSENFESQYNQYKNKFSLSKDSRSSSMNNILAGHTIKDINKSEKVDFNVGLFVQTNGSGHSEKKENSAISNYPQAQLANFRRYSFGILGSRSQDEFDKKNNSGLLAIVDTKKNCTKLKGLVIPDKPASLSSNTKALPTIVSSESVLPSKNETGVQNAVQAKIKDHSSLRLGNSEVDEKKVSKEAEATSKSNRLSEPPWKSENGSLPKYSPAFKRRTLELPRGMTSSVSPTPPSSITSPLSPPPSSPSSVCSSNASSSSNATKQNIFQFSLSHSKPVTPVLPEKPIMSPPSLPSDAEYEGDNSEDFASNTESSLSPDHSKLSTMQKVSQDVNKFKKSLDPKNVANPTCFIATSTSVNPENCYRIESSNNCLQMKHANIENSAKSNNNALSETQQEASLTSANLSRRTSEKFNLDNGQNNAVKAIQRLDSLINSCTLETPASNELSSNLNVAKTEKKSSEIIGRFRAQPVCLGDEAATHLNDNSELKDKSLNNVDRYLKTSLSLSNQTSNDVYHRQSSSENNYEYSQTSRNYSSDNSQCVNDSDNSDDKPVDPDLKPRRLSQQRTVLRNGMDSTDSVKNFRALAEQWQQRAGESREIKSPTPLLIVTSQPKKDVKQSAVNSNVKLPPSLMPRSSEIQIQPPERKSSVASIGSSFVANSIKTRETKPSFARPVSLIEDRKRLDKMANNSSSSGYFQKPATNEQLEFYNARNLSRSQMNSVSRDSLDIIEPRPRSTSLCPSKSVSVSDIRKAFETKSQQPKGITKASSRFSAEGEQLSLPLRSSRSQSMLVEHRRISSIDSTASESDISTSMRYGSVGSLTSVSQDQYGSVTSLASTTSLISPQELQQLIEEANQSLEEAGTPEHEIVVVVLHRETPIGSVGITLAGGADYEVKEVTVHKVISGSLADRDGRLRKGDRVISINGKNLKGLTHREALDILKSHRTEVVLVISREREENGVNACNRKPKLSLQEPVHLVPISRSKSTGDLNSCRQDSTSHGNAQGPIVRVELQKSSMGLGFYIEGGKDSPLGDKPLSVKRIFRSGVADKDGQLEVGDEILTVDGQSVTLMTRTEAWSFLKKIPDGPIVLMIRKARLT